MRAERLQEADLGKLPAEYLTYESLGPYLLPLFGRLHWRRLDYCLRLLSKHLRDGPIRIVDLGCGLGVFLRTLHTHFPRARLAGLDRYPREVLQSARRAWFSDGAVDFLQGNISQLPFRDASLDVVMALDVLEHVADPRIALTEIRRVLHPDGFFLVSVPTESTLLRGVRRLYMIRKQDAEGAHPHWRGTVKGFPEFREMARKQFEVAEGSFVPLRFGGPQLSYDYIALCQPRKD